MLLFKHFLKKYSPWLVLCVGVLLYVTRVWEELPPPQLSFVAALEGAAAAFAVVPIAFILYEPAEIELGLSCGIRTARFAYTRFTPCLLYSIVPATVIAACYNYVPRITDPEYIGIIPIYVPDNYRVYLAVSAFVTVLFFAALTLFLRVLLRNCFIAFAGGLISIIMLDSLSGYVSAGALHLQISYVNPFITSYFVGDYLGNHFTNLGVQNVWTINRVIFFLLALGMLIASYLLLRRERLHEVAEN